MDYLIYLFAGLLGVVGHCFCKAKDLIEYATKANIPFSVSLYLKKDWFGISMSILSVIIWLLIFGEVGAQYPKILQYIVTSFIVMGFMGSYIIQKFFSKAKDYIGNIIDKKTNIADAVILSDDGIGGSNPPKDKDEK